jgi:DNA-binding transcriptional MerR regulator
MFTVGEFSTLAQVSKRLLRYYDEIGLLKPAHIDPATGYRYYSAEQMGHLNRMLVLKELGLTLDQIRRMLSDEISTHEMQGMLLLKKVEVEQLLQGEQQRLRKIESRLQSIRDVESNKPLNVVIKNIPAQPIVSLRSIVESFEAGLERFVQIRTCLPDTSTYGFRFCICHNDGLVEHDMDLELGYLIDARPNFPVLRSDMPLQYRELPAVETMATFVVQGALESIHMGYREIGTWAEANGCRLAGLPREINLQVPQRADGSDLITEIQCPVEPVR